MKDIEYTHKLSKLLNDSLFEFATAGGQGRIAVLLKDHVQICNFHKLKYWKLIKPLGDSEWAITPEGYDFLDGKLSVPERVITFNGNIVRYEGLPIYRINVKSAIWTRSDYAINAKRVEDQQIKLF